MACKMTKSLNGKVCEYAVAGASKAWFANWFPPVVGATAVEGAIAYRVDTDGYVDKITLPTDEVFYEVLSADNTLSFSDGLLQGGNGGKYRQHSVNAVLNQYDIDVLNEGDALSLGKFIVVVLDNAGRYVLLGRTSGLKAPAGGFDYTSGAAEADANGWTIVQQGTSKEIAPLVKDMAVLTAAGIYEEVIEP
jgi:hypothetical protein